MEQFRAWAVTHPGTVRDHNEDAYVNRPDLGLWAVADGAGGHDAGEVASGLIATALDSIPPELSAEETLTQVRMRMAATHAALRERAARQGNGMIASTVVVLIARHGHFACLWAGDSRAYLLRDGALARVTRDHSLVQELVDGGQITDAEAKNHPRANVITRAVGAEVRHGGARQGDGPAGGRRPVPAVQRRAEQGAQRSRDAGDPAGPTTLRRPPRGLSTRHWSARRVTT